MVQLKGSQLSETGGQAEISPRLTLMEHMFTSLKACNFKTRMQGTYCTQDLKEFEVSWASLNL